MSKRTLIWLGVTVALAALAALGWYFIAVGLDRADKLASVLGAFVGLLGLGLAVFGVVSSPPKDTVSSPPKDTEPEPEPGGVHNEISGTVHGSAVQARDIEGGITFGTPKPHRAQEMD
ncbi:hypothetical protein OG884_07750 [Streptosporangium sp. NBC_01755]|uniref:hypothetical protein n=1 Tax=unclassified Streptosporangium TaxID=2632669 RepID=UPI002DDAD68D|nr:MULTISPECIES: hypothetical protein [unclassified Streptosporangium]WSA26771.1 hypothetical protein OIE13_02405 [Streptosporangium sp. NBC_01810]WSD01804.1 hypothetical protein OG884_07750 [Streptosporangium sp. NBC_01755]